LVGEESLILVSGCLKVEGQVSVEVKDRDLEEEKEMPFITFNSSCSFNNVSQFRFFSKQGNDCERSGKGRLKQNDPGILTQKKKKKENQNNSHIFLTSIPLFLIRKKIDRDVIWKKRMRERE